MLTVSGPISESRYSTSEYFGFFVPVLAHSTRCVRAPFAASASHRAPEKICWYLRYVCLALAIAALPCSARRRAASSGELAAFAFSSSCLSMTVSMRLTKKLATLASLEMSFPSAARFSSPAMYASATFSYADCANSSVTLMLMPSLISVWNAGTPSGVPGTLIITFGRSISPHSRRASSCVPCVSSASSGDTSMLTNPSRPLVWSYTGRSTSQASRMSRTAIRSNFSDALSFCRFSFARMSS